MKTSTRATATSRALRTRLVRGKEPSDRRTCAPRTGSRAVRCRGTGANSLERCPEREAGCLAAAAVPVSSLRGAMDDLELLEAPARSDGDARERRLGQLDRHLRLLAEALLDTGQERSAAGQDDAAVHDVGGELGRRLVQRGLDRVEDLTDGLVERAAHLLGGDHDRLRQAREHDAAAPLGLHLLGQLPRGADLELELLSGLLADQELVLLLDVTHDRLVHLVAAY